MASGFHVGAAKALVLGLGLRKKRTGKDVYYIHTSGTSNIANRPIAGKWIEERIFSDRDGIYAYEKMRDELEPYSQRTTDVVVV